MQDHHRSFIASFEPYLYVHIAYFTSYPCEHNIIVQLQNYPLQANMSLAGKLDVDVEVKSKPEIIWAGIQDSHNIFPKAFPEQYKSIEVLEGDGKGVGSVRLVHYAEDVPITTSKEKIEEVDEEKRTASYSIIDGELMEFVKFFKCKIAVVPKDEGSLIKWSCEFERTSLDTPEPELIRDFATKNFHDLDEYLVNKEKAVTN